MLNFLKDRDGNWLVDLGRVLSNMQGYNKNEALSDISMSPEEIKEVLNVIYNLTGNFHNELDIKNDIVSFVFNHVDDKSKYDFLISNSFSELYEEFEDYPEYFAKKYGIPQFLESISNDDFGTFLSNIDKRQRAQIEMRIGILDVDMSVKTAMLNYISVPDARNSEILEMLLALEGIEVDFSVQNNQMDFMNSDVLKNVVNQYYDSLDKNGKENFVASLSVVEQWNGKAYISYDSHQMSKNLQIFNYIEDENKYSMARMNVLAACLESDTVECDSKKLEILLRMYDMESRDNYIYRYLQRFQYEETSKLNLSLEELTDLVDKLDGRDKLFSMRLLGAIEPKRVMEYLSTEPEKIFSCMNVLTFEQANELLKNLSDEQYKARLILSINTNASDIAKFFPNIEDEYVRNKIAIAKFDEGRFVSNEDMEEKISKYYKLKEEFMNLPENERADFLCALPQSEQADIYKENNEIKRSLLKHIEKPEDRRKVIESMERYVDPEIQEYVDLVRQMFQEYMDKNFELSQEQKEKIEIAFATNDVYFTPNLESGVNGRADHINKEVMLAESRKQDKPSAIIDLLHEYSHVFSRTNFLNDCYVPPLTFEEGMADTFAEQVANSYFAEHRSVIIKGEKIEPQLPMISASSYYTENAYVKSMLYPLEATGMDMKAMQEYLLGDKNIFFDLTIEPYYTGRFTKDCFGNPNGVYVSKEDILRAHMQSFENVRKDSLYLQKNDLIEVLSAKSREIRENVEMDIAVVYARIEEDDIILGEVSGASYALSLDIKDAMKEKEENER